MPTIATTIGEVRLAELQARWLGDTDQLLRLEGRRGSGWPHDRQRRRNLLVADSRTRGLALAPS